jgi:hypothetical protein
MKDPLDTRTDPYHIVNEEAQRLIEQGKLRGPVQVSRETPRRELQQACAVVKARANPEKQEALRDAFYRLTQPERRLVEDIHFYCLGEVSDWEEPLPEPEWQPQQAPLPDLSVCSDLIQVGCGEEAGLLPAAESQLLPLVASTLYDEVHRPTLHITFER